MGGGREGGVMWVDPKVGLEGGGMGEECCWVDGWAELGRCSGVCDWGLVWWALRIGDGSWGRWARDGVLFWGDGGFFLEGGFWIGCCLSEGMVFGCILEGGFWVCCVMDGK